ncbi:MAG: ABC transporter substrate-binding protein [Defluviitaleaceae bacterium]|nr:ABC transporter substrate-binding protein [Defluviitaleaceae bacterium]
MKKKILALLAVLCISVFALFAFSACGNDNDGGADGETINITWWDLNEHLTGIDSIIASFESQNPGITVTTAGHSNETLHQNLQISAMNDTLPSMWFMWGGALGGRYVQYGVSRDLTSFANANNWNQVFTPASLQLATLHGELAGFPRAMNILAVYYRRDIFEDLGLSHPTTMAEFHTLVETIHAAGITPINTASVPGWHIMRLWEQFLEHYAGAVQHDQLQIFEIPWEGNQAVIDSFATFQRYAQSGFFPDGFISMEAGDLTLLLYPGFSAMQIEGPWFDSSIINDQQDIELYGIFPLPNGGTNRLSAFGEMYMFNDNLTDEELEAAVAFLHYFFEQHNVDTHPNLFGVPIPQIGREGGIPAEQVNVPAIFATGSVNGTFTISDQALPPIVVDALFNVLDYVALGTMTPEEAAAFMQRGIERHQQEG